MITKRAVKSAIAVLIMMAVLFSGCSSLGKKNSDQQEKQKLYFYYPRDGSHIIKRAIIEYNSHQQDVEVVGLEGPGTRNDFYDKLNTLRSEGETVPDIILIHDTWLARLASEQLIRPLDGGMTESRKNEFFSGMNKAMIWEGNIYGLPFWQDVPLLYYRKDLIESPPESWEELSQTAYNVMKGAELEYGLVFPGGSQENAAAFLGGLWSYYDAYPDFEAKEIKFNENSLVSATDSLKNMVSKGVITPNTLALSAEDCRMVFEGGNAVYMWNWSYAARLFLDEASPLYGRVGVVPLPASKSDSYDSEIVSGYALAMSKDTGLITEAWSFMEYLTGDEIQKKIADAGMMPAKKSLYSINWLDKLGLPHMITDLLETGHALKPGRSVDERLNMMLQALSLAIEENKSTSDLIKFIEEGVLAAENNNDEEPVPEEGEGDEGHSDNNGED